LTDEWIPISYSLHFVSAPLLCHHDAMLHTTELPREASSPSWYPLIHTHRMLPFAPSSRYDTNRAPNLPPQVLHTATAFTALSHPYKSPPLLPFPSSTFRSPACRPKKKKVGPSSDDVCWHCNTSEIGRETVSTLKKIIKKLL
jgi:hypothetical protein